MEVRAKAIVHWVEENLPPLSWQIIVMQNMKTFVKHKVTPSKFDDKTMLSADVVQSINLVIKERYKKELPASFND